MIRLQAGVYHLIISLPLNEATRVTPEDELPALIIDEDGETVRDATQPPCEPKRLHTETLVQSGAVAQEGCQGSFKEQAKRQAVVLHALLEERQSSGLTDDQISPLHNHNGDEESCMAGVLQLLTLGVGPFLAI